MVDSDTSYPTVKCPECGSERTSLPSRSSDLGWIVIRQCFKCNHIWEDKNSIPIEDMLPTPSNVVTVPFHTSPTTKIEEDVNGK